jgi:hypothetical protein
MEQVRARLTVLADAAAGPEALAPLHPWPPPDPRDAVPDPPPVPTTTVPIDLLARVDADLVAIRALLASTGAVLEEAGCRREGEDAEQWPVGAAESAGSSSSPERDKACMVALNMALNGASQAEADRYLAENFDLLDAHVIVAGAYAHSARLRSNGHNGHVT